MRYSGGAAMALMVIAAVELSAYLAGRAYIIPRAVFIFYRQPEKGLVSRSEFEGYMRRRHPVLGWPSPSEFGGDRFDPSGSRWIPSFPLGNRELVSLYGDSFTYGDEVDHRDAWSNVLSQKLAGRVANFGVGGYGVDQAYLRFKLNTGDPSPIVVLTLYPDNLKRNVNQQRYFLVPVSEFVFGLKPRFVLAGNSLRPVPLPAPSYADFLASFETPKRVLHHEYFVPDSPDGPVTWSFPYTYRILRAFGLSQVRHWMSGKPGWYGFLKETHPSKALRITSLIVRNFVSLAERRGKQAIVVVLPCRTSYNFYVRTKELGMQPLIDELKRTGIEAHDLTAGIERYLGKRPFRELGVRPEAEHSHFNAEGNRLVAELVYRIIVEQGTPQPVSMCCRP